VLVPIEWLQRSMIMPNRLIFLSYLLFHWELVDCKLSFCGRWLCVQVYGVVNIQRVKGCCIGIGAQARRVHRWHQVIPNCIIRYHHYHRISHEKIGPPHIN
jgi:hypothetical protein